MERKKKCTFKRLALVEVQEMFLMNSQGKSIREISKTTKRSTSTVHRILNEYRPASCRVWLAMGVWERAWHVYAALKGTCRRGGNHGRLRDPVVREYVLTKLVQEHWSPEEIASRIRKDLVGASISAKTIYSFLKHERADLKKYLMEKGMPRRQRVTHRRGRIKQGAPTKRSIHTRSEIVAERKELGHWEGDLIVSKRGGSGAVLSLTERVSRKKLLRFIPDTCAKTVLGYLWAIFENLPPAMRKSLTLDNGSEFAYSELIKLEQLYPDFQIYYCDPYSSWQKGSVENSNRDVRWYLPKGTDFAEVPKHTLADVEARLGRRPLKCLGYQTPEEYLSQKLAA